ncbi:MAG: alpha/beta hydrolase [Nitratireductor sp.]|nr:alpha/beta hydrolase [Nitratireductor sp.]
MVSPTEDRSTPDARKLRAWYEDSLRLMHADSGVKGPHRAERIDGYERPNLGILYMNGDGGEIWAYGHTQACRDFADSFPLSSLGKRDIHMRAHNDSIILFSCIKEVARIVAVNQMFLTHMLREIYPDVELSNAELQLLVQILCGMSLREAAVENGVAYETKRTQFKSLAAKTGIRTQSEVVRITLAMLMSYILDAFGARPGKRGSNVVDEKAFLDLYYPDTFRFHEIAMDKNRVLRVADAGPILGRPIVFAHSQTLPVPAQISNDWLQSTNTRLLIPLRNGFLQGDAHPFSPEDHIARSAREIADTIRLFCSGSARLVAHSTGVPYALRAVLNEPELTREFVIAAAAHLGAYSNGKVNQFVAVMKQLAMSNNFILDKTYDQYLKRMSTPSGFRSFLLSTYKDSPADVAIFDAITGNPMEYSWIFETYRLSRWSVIRDITMGNMDVWADAECTQTPVVFVHGSGDSINPVEAARTVQKRFPNSFFVELEGEGQSLFLTCFEKLITNDITSLQKSGNTKTKQLS